MSMPSQTPAAIKARLRRLHDPAWAEHEAAQNRKARNSRKAQRMAKVAAANAAMRPSRPWTPTKVMQDRVRHHLAKGRDAADIAMREGIMLSVARRIVDHVRAVQAADPTQDSRRPREAGRA